MSGSKYEEDVSMPSKVMGNSILEKPKSSSSNLEPNFHISRLGPNHMTKFGRNV